MRSERSGGRRAADALIVLTASALALSACGGPDAKNGRKTITVGQISPGTSQTPLFVAVDQGFFKQAGLDVELQNLSGGTPSAMASLASGDVAMLAAGATEVIEYLGRGVINGRVVAELADQNYDIVGAHGMTDLAQLKGKLVGISGENGADQIYFNAVLARHGMKPTDVTFLTSGGTANRLTALSTGVVQAIIVANANRDSAAKAGTVLVKSNESGVEVPSAVLFANADLLKERAGDLRTFAKALSAATEWIRANPVKAALSCAKHTGASAANCAGAIAINLDRAVNNPYTWSGTGAVNAAGFASALKVMATQVPATAKLGVADVVDTSIAGTKP